MRFIDLFAGLGGFHVALARLGHECVFASELDVDLQRLYKVNFPEAADHVFGDLRASKHLVPHHDILCAGFPCQPFSKSGAQRGLLDETRGTLFHEIIDILDQHRPEFVLLENVGNFERHDGGRTWDIVQRRLTSLDYSVRGTVHKKSGGHGLISPHHFGFPHHRDRFFIVARRGELVDDPFPRGDRKATTSLADIVQSDVELTTRDLAETQIGDQRNACVEHWNRLLESIPGTIPLPSFPIWGDELDASYHFEDTTPFAEASTRIGTEIGYTHPDFAALLQQELAQYPAYARAEEFPYWKRRFIRQNRKWFAEIREYIPKGWGEALRDFSPSMRKLEWNCQGEVRNLWHYVLQFRPSGLRVKRYTSVPALVAMTTSQIPILGPNARFLTRVEGLRLQGFPDQHALPSGRERSFAALGNAVHVGVVAHVAASLLNNLDSGRSNGTAPTAHEEICRNELLEAG